MMNNNNSIYNIKLKRKIITPNQLIKELPLDNKLKLFIEKTKKEIINILNGTDTRKILIIGPCSIHNIESAKEYSHKLLELSNRVNDKILIVMRTYFEKPRSKIGWKGFINDPFLDNSHDIEHGLKKARELLLYINRIGLPCGYELLELSTINYIGDLISWCSIGARTSESQIHRQIISSLNIPTGFKNSTSGNIDSCISSVFVVKEEHTFCGISMDNIGEIVITNGNPNCHIILRGSENSSNYHIDNIKKAKKLMNNLKYKNIIIDCSHGNSRKDYKKQSNVFKYICSLLKENHKIIIGMMLESHLDEGKQEFKCGQKEILARKSITDSCISIEETNDLVIHLYNIL
jgi:3-deoxy-7-phosphoheptulonate synthase